MQLLKGVHSFFFAFDFHLALYAAVWFITIVLNTLCKIPGCMLVLLQRSMFMFHVDCVAFAGLWFFFFLCYFAQVCACWFSALTCHKMLKNYGASLHVVIFCSFFFLNVTSTHKHFYGTLTHKQPNTHIWKSLNCICISLALNKVNVELPEKLGQRWGNLLVFFLALLCVKTRHRCVCVFVKSMWLIWNENCMDLLNLLLNLRLTWWLA